MGNLYTKVNLDMLDRNPFSTDLVKPMATTRTPEQQEQADALLDDVQDQTDDILREVTQLLSDLPDEHLFGATELLVRDKVLQIVARLYQARIAQKKTAMKAPESIVPTATDPLISIPIASGIPSELGGPFAIHEPTTTVDPVGKDSLPGMRKSV